MSQGPLNPAIEGFFFEVRPTTDICVTVTGPDTDTIRRARAAAEVEADLVELRLDSMRRPDAAGALAGRTKPAIVTCRPRREGGLFDGAEDDRLAILRQAHESGAEFIDVEWDARAGDLIRARQGHGIIVSRHFFDRAPANPVEVLGELRAAGGEIAKLAVMASRVSDLLPLADSAGSNGSIVIGMGPAGLPSRILAGRFGSRWTYAGDAVAPGQITAGRLLHEFRFRRIRPDAAVYALLGRPVTHSLSPAMHNAGFAALGLNAVYVPVEAADLEDFRAFATALGVRGASVTIPFKTDILPGLDEVSPLAHAAGAVNTISIRNQRWLGTNTDADGFLEPLRKRRAIAGQRIVVLGAGGAARAVALALGREGARVAIAARRSEAARTVAAAVGGSVSAWPPEPGSWDVLVNATPVGGRSQPGNPLDEAPGLERGALVYDLVYDPAPTALMRRAADAGCDTIGGLEMLIAQAERQFEIWTGQQPPADLFAQAAANALALRTSPTT